MVNDDDQNGEPNLFGDESFLPEDHGPKNFGNQGRGQFSTSQSQEPKRRQRRESDEAKLYPLITRAWCEAGGRLFRNHVGVSQHGTGRNKRVVRTGLVPGSSDLIGWAPLRLGGRFTAIEVKPPGWKTTPKWLDSKQAKFIRAVRAGGGIAGVATSVEDALAMLEENYRITI
ncbi:MAG: VRR-NUC domain-containing protein [Pseudomonadota bacterium]